MFKHTDPIAKTGAIALFSVALSLSSLAFAAGGGSSGGDASATNPPPPPIDCKKEKGAGWVYSEKQKKCVKQTTLNDGELYKQGHDLALAGLYDSALDVLNAIHNKNDSMVLTMIGYSTRKLGNYDRGLDYYRQALAIDSNNVNTREYLGEAYVEKGHIDLAKAELVKVEAVCGTSCEQYRDLAAAIAGKPSST